MPRTTIIIIQNIGKKTLFTCVSRIEWLHQYNAVQLRKPVATKNSNNSSKTFITKD